MRLRKFIVVLVVCIFCSCNTIYRKTFVPITKYDEIKRLNQIHQKKVAENEAFLTFTKNFNNDKIKIFDDERVIIDSTLSTGKYGIIGMADSFKINKEAVIIIQINNERKLLTIYPKEMKNYKFIYVEKNGGKYNVEFNNSKRPSAE